jgi:beta-lactamase class A
MSFAVLSWAFVLAAQLPSADPLPESIAAIQRRFSGRIGLAALHLESGRSLYLNADEKVQTASVIKLPIMVEAFYQAHEGRLNLEERIRVSAADRVVGSGILQDLGEGLAPSLSDVITLMIVLSDNQATNYVIDRVGIANVNSRMRRLGLEHTKLFKKVFKPAEGPLTQEEKSFGLGVTTPREMVRLLERLANRELVNETLSGRMMDILLKQRDVDQIPRYLGNLKLEGPVTVAHKTGALNTVRNDVGIVSTPRGRVLLAIFCQESRDQRWTPDNEATIASARLAEAAARALLPQR